MSLISLFGDGKNVIGKVAGRYTMNPLQQIKDYVSAEIVGHIESENGNFMIRFNLGLGAK